MAPVHVRKELGLEGIAMEEGTASSMSNSVGTDDVVEGAKDKL